MASFASNCGRSRGRWFLQQVIFVATCECCLLRWMIMIIVVVSVERVAVGILTVVLMMVVVVIVRC